MYSTVYTQSEHFLLWHSSKKINPLIWWHLVRLFFNFSLAKFNLNTKWCEYKIQKQPPHHTYSFNVSGIYLFTRFHSVASVASVAVSVSVSLSVGDIVPHIKMAIDWACSFFFAWFSCAVPFCAKGRKLGTTKIRWSNWMLDKI